MDVWMCVSFGLVTVGTAPGSLPRGVQIALDTSTLLLMTRAAVSTQNFSKVMEAIRDVFSTHSSLSASFLLHSEVGDCGMG